MRSLSLWAGWPRLQREGPSRPEVELERVVDQDGWRYDLDVVDQRIAHVSTKSVEIELPARRRAPAAASLWPTKLGAIARERRVAEASDRDGRGC